MNLILHVLLYTLFVTNIFRDRVFSEVNVYISLVFVTADQSCIRFYFVAHESFNSRNMPYKFNILLLFISWYIVFFLKVREICKTFYILNSVSVNLDAALLPFPDQSSSHTSFSHFSSASPPPPPLSTARMFHPLMDIRSLLHILRLIYILDAFG